MMADDRQNDSNDESQRKIRTTPNAGSIPVTDNRINSRDLFASSRELLISHGDETYRLRLTAQNKLILTK
jgi:hemin uptake protein HemP